MIFYLKIKASDELAEAVIEMVDKKGGGYKLPPEGEIITIDADSILNRAGITVDTVKTVLETIYKESEAVGKQVMDKTMFFIQNKSTGEYLHKTGPGDMDFDFMDGLPGAVALPMFPALQTVKELKEQTPEFDFEAIEVNKALGTE